MWRANTPFVGEEEKNPRCRQTLFKREVLYSWTGQPPTKMLPKGAQIHLTRSNRLRWFV